MKHKKMNISLIYYIFIFFIISIITLYGTLDYIPTNNLVSKQATFYLFGLILIIFIIKLDSEFLLKYSFIIYLTNIALLFYVLIFGDVINGTKAWINVPIFGSLQPSEFMKIGLILFLAKTINKAKRNNSSDFKIILKSFIIFIIPTILTFLEPDTGAVFVYFVIATIILFGSGISLKWFTMGFLLLVFLVSSFLYIYFFKQDLFINVLGTDFFYRIDRLTSWTTSSGMQLENSIISISSSGILGHGFNNIPIYFPELQTDFIFASFVSCFGLLGATFLITFLTIFDLKIVQIIKNNSNNCYKLIFIGILGALIYQQIQNIAMTIGLLPITGITLPFISSGGSSLLSYLILIGIVINLSNSKKKSNIS